MCITLFRHLYTSQRDHPIKSNIHLTPYVVITMLLTVSLICTSQGRLFGIIQWALNDTTSFIREKQRDLTQMRRDVTEAD